MTKGTITSHDISDFKGGWFIGDFNPSLFGSNKAFNKSVPKFGCSYLSPFLVNNKLLIFVDACSSVVNVFLNMPLPSNGNFTPIATSGVKFISFVGITR